MWRGALSGKGGGKRGGGERNYEGLEEKPCWCPQHLACHHCTLLTAQNLPSLIVCCCCSCRPFHQNSRLKVDERW